MPPACQLTLPSLGDSLSQCAYDHRVNGGKADLTCVPNLKRKEHLILRNALLLLPPVMSLLSGLQPGFCREEVHGGQVHGS